MIWLLMKLTNVDIDAVTDFDAVSSGTDVVAAVINLILLLLLLVVILLVLLLLIRLRMLLLLLFTTLCTCENPPIISPSSMLFYFLSDSEFPNFFEAVPIEDDNTLPLLAAIFFIMSLDNPPYKSP